MRVRLVVAFLLALFLALHAHGALADEQGSPAERAAELKQRGDAAMDALRYDDALSAYGQAYAISHDPAILYNMGRVHQARGEYPEALDVLLSFDRDAPPSLKQRVPLLAELIADVRSKVVFVTIKANVVGARVIVRDRVIGVTPLPGEVRLSAGRAVVEVTADDYLPFRREVDLVGGTQFALDAQLSRKPSSTVLVIRTVPSAASVLVDDKSGASSPAEVAVAPGAHRVLARHDGYDPLDTSAFVAPGERKELDLSLVPSTTAITGRWWFWTGVGVVVVAAGAVITYALLTPRSADQGNGFMPGQVASRLVAF
jgi:hypothetical protein